MLARYSPSYLVDDLAKSRMSVSVPENFNDPFEFHFKMGKPITATQAKQRIREARPAMMAKLKAQSPTISRAQLREEQREASKMLLKELLQEQSFFPEIHRKTFLDVLLKKARLVCFSEPNVDDVGEIAMWAYYADGHKGVRLHIDEAKFDNPNGIIEIEYDDEPPVFDVGLHPDSEGYEAFVLTTLKRKSLAWQHEREKRLLINKAACVVDKDSKGKLRDYLPLETSWTYRIDLGTNCTEETEKKARELKKVFSNLAVWKASMNKDAYRLDYVQIA